MKTFTTTARWPRYEADDHPDTWIVKDTSEHPIIKHVAAYSYRVPNVDLPDRLEGIWAEISGYQNVNYFTQVDLSLPIRCRQHFHFWERFQRWEDAQAKALEMIIKAKRILLRSQSLYSDARLGHPPPYIDALLQIWLAPPIRAYSCGCHPGRVLCPDAQEIWDQREGFFRIEWGSRYIDDVQGYRALLAEFRSHYQRLVA